jgi:hypothetical protein
MGMIGLDKGIHHSMRKVQLRKLLKSSENVTAKSVAKAIVSPFYGVNDFAFATASA